MNLLSAVVCIEGTEVQKAGPFLWLELLWNLEPQNNMMRNKLIGG